MALLQKVRAVDKLSDKDRDKLDELVKQAQNAIPKINIKVEDKQGRVHGCITNDNNYWIKRCDFHNFSGKFKKLPEYIGPEATVVFEHQGDSPAGWSKGGVYYGTENNGEPPCGWLLSWSVPGKNAPCPICPSHVRNRVYVEAGKLQGEIDWTEVEKELDKSGSESCCFDPSTNARASAKITNDSNFAALGSHFSNVGPF